MRDYHAKDTLETSMISATIYIVIGITIRQFAPASWTYLVKAKNYVVNLVKGTKIAEEVTAKVEGAVS